MDVHAAFSKWPTKLLSVCGSLHCRGIMKGSAVCSNRSGWKSNPRCGHSAWDACTVAQNAIAENNFSLANAEQTKHTQPDEHGDCVSFVTAQEKHRLEMQET